MISEAFMYECSWFRTKVTKATKSRAKLGRSPFAVSLLKCSSLSHCIYSLEHFNDISPERHFEPRRVEPAGIASVVEVHAMLAAAGPSETSTDLTLTVPDTFRLVVVAEKGALGGERLMVDDGARMNEADNPLEEGRGEEDWERE